MALKGINNIGRKEAQGFFNFKARTAINIKCTGLQLSGKSNYTHLSTHTRHKTNLMKCMIWEI